MESFIVPLFVLLSDTRNGAFFFFRQFPYVIFVRCRRFPMRYRHFRIYNGYIEIQWNGVLREAVPNKEQETHNV